VTQYDALILSECAETLFKGCSGRARSPFAKEFPRRLWLVTIFLFAGALAVPTA